jgi:hypothetical protein
MLRETTQIGSNRFFTHSNLNCYLPKLRNLLSKTTVANLNISDVSEQSSNWWRRRELNPRP